MLQSPQFWSVLGGSAIVYWLLPGRVRSVFLLAVSFFFMDWVARNGNETAGFSRYVIWFLTAWSILFFYALRWKKTASWIAPWLLLVIIGQLLYFKYIPPLMEAIFSSVSSSILIPLGISFFTFKLIHYFLPHKPLRLDRDCQLLGEESPTDDAVLYDAVRYNADLYKEQARCALSLAIDFLEMLERIGVYDQSLVIIVSDHGLGGRKNFPSAGHFLQNPFISRFICGNQDWIQHQQERSCQRLSHFSFSLPVCSH